MDQACELPVQQGDAARRGRRVAAAARGVSDLRGGASPCSSAKGDGRARLGRLALGSPGHRVQTLSWVLRLSGSLPVIAYTFFRGCSRGLSRSSRTSSSVGALGVSPGHRVFSGLRLGLGGTFLGAGSYAIRSTKARVTIRTECGPLFTISSMRANPIRRPR